MLYHCQGMCELDRSDLHCSNLSLSQCRNCAEYQTSGSAHYLVPALIIRAEWLNSVYDGDCYLMIREFRSYYELDHDGVGTTQDVVTVKFMR